MTDETLQSERDKTPHDGGAGVRTLFSEPVAMGATVEVASGVWWLRLPLSSAMGHVNVYLLEDDAGWTLVDTGVQDEACYCVLQAALAREPFARRPLRIIATHFHPDHVGAAGRFTDLGAELWTSRLTWLYARMFQLDDREPPHAEHVCLAERAGLSGVALAAYRRNPHSDYRRSVAPLPPTFVRMEDGDVVSIGERRWTVWLGNGHAPEHITLWSDDGLVITGDQMLPGTATNLSLHPSEPDADLVRDWLESCERFIALGDDDRLCLPGHHLPFTGMVTRCRQLLASQDQVLQRLLECLRRPRTAVECLPHIYGRDTLPFASPASIAEAMGFLNHLARRGLVTRVLNGERYLWRRSSASVAHSPAISPPPRRPK